VNIGAVTRFKYVSSEFGARVLADNGEDAALCAAVAAGIESSG